MKLFDTIPTKMIVLIGLILVFISCHKKSKSDFKFNKYEYTVGDQLDISNFSKSKIWTIQYPSGEIVDTIYDHNPAIIISPLYQDGVYSLSFYDNKTELAGEMSETKSFLVKSIRRVLSIKGSGKFKDFDAFVDDSEIGKSKNGVLQTKLPVGLWIIKVVSPSGETKSATVSISQSNSNSISFN